MVGSQTDARFGTHLLVKTLPMGMSWVYDIDAPGRCILFVGVVKAMFLLLHQIDSRGTLIPCGIGQGGVTTSFSTWGIVLDD